MKTPKGPIPTRRVLDKATVERVAEEMLKNPKAEWIACGRCGAIYDPDIHELTEGGMSFKHVCARRR